MHCLVETHQQRGQSSQTMKRSLKRHQQLQWVKKAQHGRVMQTDKARGQSARRRPELESGGEVLLAVSPRKGVQWHAAEPDDDRRGPEGWTATTPERCCALRTFGLPKLATHRRDCKAWHCERRIYDAPEPPGGRLGNHVAP